MSILGGFEGLVYSSSAKGGGAAASNIGVATRLNPVVDPGNINVRGDGRRGLYDILLGMVEPVFNLDMWPTDKDFITTYQDGQTAIPFLHYKTGSIGLTFTNVYVNRMSVESRHNEAINLSTELWAESGEALATQAWGAVVTTPYRWLDSLLKIATATEFEWWEWRYEVVNNLQRLGDVNDRSTRSIEARHREVTGMIVKDCKSFTEFTELMNTAGADPSKFKIQIQLDGSDLLNSNSRWGRIEAPSGPEDLIAKRFPFTALDLT